MEKNKIMIYNNKSLGKGSQLEESAQERNSEKDKFNLLLIQIILIISCKIITPITIRGTQTQ